MGGPAGSVPFMEREWEKKVDDQLASMEQQKRSGTSGTCKEVAIKQLGGKKLGRDR